MSYTIFLVDDEPPSLRSLKRRVLETMLDFEIAGEAYNGEEALAKIRSAPVPPDVLLTDIQMPVMDGLTFFKKITELYPEIFKIIVSGYKEFEYAKQALDLRVHKYLLKPLQVEDIYESLLSIRQELMLRRYQEMQTLLQAALRHAPAAEMNAADRGRFHGAGEGLSEGLQEYHVISVYSEVSLQAKLGQSGGAKWTAGFFAEQLATHLGSKHVFWILEQDKENEFIWIVSGEVPLPLLEEALHQLIRHAATDQAALTFALQSNVCDLSALSFCVRQLFAFLHHRLVTGKSQLLRKNPDMPVQHGSGTRVVQKVRQHIQDHYYKPLEMKELSQSFGISSTYLSTIFKKTYQMTPMEYVTHVRMEHAKRLIRQDPDLLIKDIAEMVGIMDNHYFSRVFKDTVGYSPSEFKQLQPRK